MFGLGMPELIIILVIVIIIFGASRLPQLGEGLGKAIRGFKKGVSEGTEAKKDETSGEKKS
jgi:sec-independent protein translocase protein TatA